MKRHPLQFLAAVLFVLAVVLGYILIRPQNHPQVEPPVVASPPPPAASPRQVRAAADSLDWETRIAEAGAGDFRGLMDALLEIGDAELKHHLVTLLMKRWLREDRADIVAWFDSLEVSRDKERLDLAYLALQDVLSDLTEELAASEEVFLLVQRLIAYLAEADPERALAWAENWLLDDTQQNALASIAHGMASRDIDRSLQIVEMISSPLRRMQALAQVGVHYARRDSGAALRWAGSLADPGERALTLNSVLLVVAREDLHLAAEQMKLAVASISRDYETRRVNDLATLGITEADIANDAAEYVEMLKEGAISPPTSPDLDLLVESGKLIAALLSEQNAGEGIQWANDLGPGFLNLSSIAGSLETWAKSDPVSSIAYVNSDLEGNPALLDAIYKEWASADAIGAAHGLSLVGNPHDRAALAGTVARQWAASGDIEGVSAFVMNSPRELVTDQTKIIVAKTLAQKHPVDAWNIALTIESPSGQARAVRETFSHMIFADPALAGNVLNTSAVSPALGEELAEMLDSASGH